MATSGPQTLGDYLLVEQIGEGGMAEVYRAQNLGGNSSIAGNEEVVVKRIKPSLFRSVEFPIFREMFLNEAKLVRGLQHANLARVFSLNEALDKNLGVRVPFIVGEFIKGQQLWNLMRIGTLGFTGKPISPRIAAFLVREIARGLGHAHDYKDPQTKRPLPIIHRDVSPENVMISEDGAVKVIDFGVAKAIGGFGPQTQTGIIKGKLAYMAPEQVAQKVLPATDVFGAGIVLWELLTGRRLFGGGNELLVVNRVLKAEITRPSQTIKDIPAELEQVLMTALSRDLNVRYPHGNAFADALTQAMTRVGSLRGTTNLDVKRWAKSTLADGARISSGWDDDPAQARGRSSDNEPVPGSASASEEGVELSGDDLVFAALDGPLDPAVREAVTQGMRTLTPAMLMEERARMNRRPSGGELPLLPGMRNASPQSTLGSPPPPFLSAGASDPPGGPLMSSRPLLVPPGASALADLLRRMQSDRQLLTWLTTVAALGGLSILLLFLLLLSSC